MKILIVFFFYFRSHWQLELFAGYGGPLFSEAWHHQQTRISIESTYTAPEALALRKVQSVVEVTDTVTLFNGAQKWPHQAALELQAKASMSMALARERSYMLHADTVATLMRTAAVGTHQSKANTTTTAEIKPQGI